MDFASSIKTRFTFLGIYQIVGGLVGLLLIAWYFLQVDIFSGLYLFAPIISIPFFGYSIYCGVLLLQKKESGLKLSLINQWFQLFGFIFFGYGLKYCSGFFLGIGINMTNSTQFALNFGISTWLIDFNNPDTTFLIHFNFVALALIIYITKLQQKIEMEKMAQLMELGRDEINFHTAITTE